MSEKKLCPFRKLRAIQRGTALGVEIGSEEDLLPCLEEKCAMWRGPWLFMDESRVPGHCGLAGKP